MDLLAGYGSDDSQSADAAPPAPAAATTAPPKQSISTSLATLLPPAQPSSGGGDGGLFASLPPPSEDIDGSSLGGSGFFSDAVPAPKAAAAKPAASGTAGQRKVVQLRTLKPLAASALDEEDEQPKKKLKVSTKGLSFLDSLPKPKHDAGLGDGNALGGGGKAARSLGGGYEPALPSGASSGDGGTLPAVPDADVAATYLSNDAYRVSQPPASGAAKHGAVASPAEYGAAAPPAEYAAYTHHGYAQPGAQRNYSAGHGAAHPDGNAMLAAAMAQESGRGGGGGGPADPFADLNIQFKEVSQAKLTYVDPSKKAAMKGTRQALGKDYEMQLRQEADKAEPNKLSKRKHQISSLYHASKMKELEMLSDHGQTLKTKRETQAKYGW